MILTPVLQRYFPNGQNIYKKAQSCKFLRIIYISEDLLTRLIDKRCSPAFSRHRKVAYCSGKNMTDSCVKAAHPFGLKNQAHGQPWFSYSEQAYPPVFLI